VNGGFVLRSGIAEGLLHVHWAAEVQVPHGFQMSDGGLRRGRAGLIRIHCKMRRFRAQLECCVVRIWTARNPSASGASGAASRAIAGPGGRAAAGVTTT